MTQAHAWPQSFVTVRLTIYIYYVLAMLFSYQLSLLMRKQLNSQFL